MTASLSKNRHLAYLYVQITKKEGRGDRADFDNDKQVIAAEGEQKASKSLRAARLLFCL